ncbi:MAG: hypothetical protein ACREPI_04075, partial [Candidatus Dormibacterales bacterium]
MRGVSTLAMTFVVVGMIAIPGRHISAAAAPAPGAHYTHLRLIGPTTLTPTPGAPHPSGPAPFLTVPRRPAPPGSRPRLRVLAAGIRGPGRRAAVPHSRVLQVTTAGMPLMSVSAQIAQLGSDQSVAPPDTQMAAGPNYLVEALNASLSIWTKAGAPVGTPSDLNTFFAVPTGYHFTDPRVLYDALSGRWFL